MTGTVSFLLCALCVGVRSQCVTRMQFIHIDNVQVVLRPPSFSLSSSDNTESTGLYNISGIRLSGKKSS